MKNARSSLALLCAAALLPLQSSFATSKTYHGRGQVVSIMKAKSAAEKTSAVVDHETIPNFMHAMRMEIPLAHAADAKKLKPGLKISFDLLMGRGLTLSNIKALPPKTPLKLAKK